jgi:uncharacterized protein YegP (UPF0339 family)
MRADVVPLIGWIGIIAFTLVGAGYLILLAMWWREESQYEKEEEKKMAAYEEVTVKKDVAGEWRWHKESGPSEELSEIVSDSGEGYRNKAEAIAAAEEHNPGVAVTVEE